MMDNWTLINLVLRLTGPMHERTTTNVLLLLQTVPCVLGLALRLWHSRSVCAEPGDTWWSFLSSAYGNC
jgi:hypothetical protein